ncbi:acyltransferase [Methylosinus sp. H3A]|uniref:acyltransferase family protein n=1 Tax=Methylosinus sp. H3A TaxID=2785786 RepID=UPI0018C2594B|nr:acyltransferase family protein [Methylosinus sp. H3A]MBG0811041.1 acyltransferase [Methylosinus sp. H3A]
MSHAIAERSASADASVPATRHWPEIDGLRTIAVVSVLLFHLDHRLLEGGFVGVDVFFVISGFLITTLLVGEMDEGRFRILDFYRRRVARIAPAALFVVAGSILVGAFVYSAQDFASLGANSLAAVLVVVNLKLLMQGDYFVTSSDAQPLLHFWSLAVEEQFYALLPLLLAIAGKGQRRARTLFACCAASFVLCVAATAIAPSAAFYLLPTRAWELLAGSLLAIGAFGGLRERRASACLTFGMVLLAFSLVLVGREQFPGWIAAAPVIASVAIIAGLVGGGSGAARSILAHPAMVFVGRRSYSLYLWHWPIFSFVDYRFYLEDPSFGRALKIVLTVVATLLTYRLLEHPLRLRLNALPPRAALGGYLICAAILGALGYAIRDSHYLGADARSVARGGVMIHPEGAAHVVVIGDSQGAMYGYELSSLARELDFRLNLLSVPDGNELPGERNTLWPQVCEFLSRNEPDVILLAQAWSSKLGESHKDALRLAFVHLSSHARVIVLAQPPKPMRDATRAAILAGARPPFFPEPEHERERSRATAILKELESESVSVLEVADLFLDANGAIRFIGVDGRSNYHDPDHLSDTGAARVRQRLQHMLRSALASRLRVFEQERVHSH